MVTRDTRVTGRQYVMARKHACHTKGTEGQNKAADYVKRQVREYKGVEGDKGGWRKKEVS